MDKASQIDELTESDILEALGEGFTKDENTPSSSDEDIKIDNHQEEKTKSSEAISVDSSLTKADLSTLINELLSNKTLEITIKIKD